MDIITTIIVFLYYTFIATSHKPMNVEEHFDRITKYELIFVDTTSFETKNIIEFDAFSQHYIIKLEENADLIPSNIGTPHGNPTIKYGLHQFYSHLTESCHYFGQVLNANDSSVALSLCNKRGIRGTIYAFDDILTIKPTKYYDTEYDRDNYHDINDEHLVYKQSDYNYTSLTKRRESVSIPVYNHIKSSINNTDSNKRRLAYNGGSSKVEIFILSDPTLTNYFKNKYSSWYDQLYSHLSDTVNGMSSLYTKTNWGSNVGSIRIKWVELEVATSYSGRWSSLKPRTSGSCNSDYSNSGCKIKDGYLDKFSEWFNDYKSFSKMDVGHLWSAAKLLAKDDKGNEFAILGQANGGGVVCSSWAQGINTFTWNAAEDKATGAHELGHGFSMEHDGKNKGDNGCDEDAGLMGGSNWKFSSCSIKELKGYFKTANGLSCLGKTHNSGFKTNKNDVVGGGSEPDPDPNKGTDPDSDDGNSDGGNCIRISNMMKDRDGKSYNGKWKPNGQSKNGQKVYTKSGLNNRYLCWNKNNNRWIITESVCSYSGNDMWAYCRNNGDNVMRCKNNWKVYDDGWETDKSVLIDSCSGSFEMTHHSCSKGNNVYQQNVCVYNNNTLWNGIKLFIAYNDLCDADYPIYHHTEYNGSDDSVQEIYFLHYVENNDYDWNNSDDRVGEWVISEDMIGRTGVGVCYEEDLEDCVENRWTVAKHNGDVVNIVLDEYMRVSVDECGVIAETNRINDSKQLVWTMVFVLLVIAIVIGMIGIVFIWKRKKSMGKVIIEDESEEEIEVEIDGEVETETPIII